MSVDASRAVAYTDLGALGELRRDARAQDPAALREAARHFETLFTRMMLESMRAASLGDSLSGSREGEFYRDMLDDQLAMEMSRGRGLGLAEQLVEQLLRSGLQGDRSIAAGTAGARNRDTADRRVASVEVQRAFVERIWPAAEAAGRALGVSPRMIVAHAALETGWGRAMPAAADGTTSLNLFGIKAGGTWQGATVRSETAEFQGGAWTRRAESFRAYPSYEASVADYSRLLGGSARYRDALGAGEDAVRFARALQTGGYATDPSYADKLVSVADSVDRLLDASLKGGNRLPIAEAERG